MNRPLVAALLVAVSLAVSPGHARSPLQTAGGGSAATAAATIVKRQLSNGLGVWIVEQHELPVVQMSLLVQAGTAADPPGRYGAASLMSAMLTQGAGARSAVEIADLLDRLVANLSAASNVDSTSLQLYVPVRGLAEALPLMADVAQRPTFPRQELDTLREQRLVTLRNARADPDAIAALAFARGSYSPSHRSAAPLIGTADSIGALTPDDLRVFHQTAFRPANSTLLVVGDVAPDELLPLIETHFGKWQPAGPAGALPEAPATPRQSARQLLLVDMPGAPQSRLLVGSVGGANSMADFFPMQVLNAVVKGRLSPDRNTTLREYTTGVRSGFDLRKSATPFIAATAVQVDKTGESLKALLDELGGVAREVPADELARAKEEVARDFPKTFETRGRISSRLRVLEALVVYGLPDDYYARYLTSTQAVAAADVQRVAQQYIHPDHLTIVIVGDRKTIEPPIRALNLGAMKPVTIDEVFATAK